MGTATGLMHSVRTEVPASELKALTREIRERVRDKHGDLFLKEENRLNRQQKEKVIRTEVRDAAGRADEAVEEYVLAHLIGLGDLEVLIKDKSISEIMINRPDQVYIERNGRLLLTELKFESPDEVLNLVQRMVQLAGRRVDFSNPLVNARLPDGSRVNAAIKPSAEYPAVTIRRFVRHRFNAEELLQHGYLSGEMLTFLKCVVEGGANIVICGAAGSGKTTFLRFLASYIPNDERIVVIEDTRELDLENPHMISLESSDKGNIYDLMVNALRMRPDRIIMGECRGIETFELLQAMGTGHQGSLTTLHANNGKMEMAQRLIRAMLGSGMTDRELKQHIMGAIDLSVYVKKYKGGVWRITNIAEVRNGENGDEFKDIYVYDHNRRRHVARNGLSPELIDRLQDNLEDLELPDIAPFKRGGGN